MAGSFQSSAFQTSAFQSDAVSSSNGFSSVGQSQAAGMPAFGKGLSRLLARAGATSRSLRNGAEFTGMPSKKTTPEPQRTALSKKAKELREMGRGAIGKAGDHGNGSKTNARTPVTNSGAYAATAGGSS